MAKAASPKGRRLHEAAQARRRAAAATVGPACDVAVVGAGAAGLAAAIAAKTAAPEASVVLLEAGPEAGKPILATGNGRCNLSNEELDPARYNDPAFAAAVMGGRAEKDVAAFFSGLGLAMEAEEGRLYPRSRVAASVRNVLAAEAERLGVVVATLRPVTGLEPCDGRWSVGYEERFREAGSGWAQRTLDAAAVVVATGGGTGDGLARLGLPLEPFSPVLCALAVEPSFADALDGRRARCSATLVRMGSTVCVQRGEVLFRTGALSGIAAFDLSRFAVPGDTVSLDLVPELSEAEFAAYVASRLEAGGTAVLDGLLDPVVAGVLLGEARTAGQNVADKVAALVKRLSFEVTGLAQTDRAQVTRGGVAVGAVDPATMGARNLPGLYLAGEVLNVDGACGGYNLAFAWLSGLKAGARAARFSVRIDEA